jgi:hypothetical protein
MIPSITLSQLHHQGSGPSFSFCGRPTLGKSAKRRGCDYKGGAGFCDELSFVNLVCFCASVIITTAIAKKRATIASATEDAKETVRDLGALCVLLW